MNPALYKAEKLNKLSEVFTRNLIACRKEFPDKYAWAEEQAPRIADNFMRSIRENGLGTITISHGPAWERTFKELGLKRTYADGERWLSETPINAR